MNYFELFLIAVGLAMDAFAVSLCKGLEMKRFQFSRALFLGGLFGLFQALMPLAGFYLSKNFVQHIEGFDHWIAFLLLLFIGGKMIKEARREEEENSGFSLGELLVLAVATSIDALAVGVTFAILPKIDIRFAALSIGGVTVVLCVLAVGIGHKFGTKIGSKAEYSGGIILILLGCKILLEHLGIFI
ncbi:MAG: manganese efflux pump MntP family protein [Mailhella sp.]|nr:manganese efflux pump MntP family protein [Mailhella sp.]